MDAARKEVEPARAVELLTDQWFDSGQSCTQTSIDLRDALAESLAEVDNLAESLAEAKRVIGRVAQAIKNRDEMQADCPHGNKPTECEACFRESDFQFDASREARFFGRD